MKARAIFNIIARNDDATVFVMMDGDHIPVVSARYEPGGWNQRPKIVLGLDRFELLKHLEKVERGENSGRPHPEPGEP